MPAADETVGEVDDLSLRSAIATGQMHDSDYIVVPDELLPYISAVEEHFHIGLVDPSFLLKCVEVFVRGSDVAWSFAHPVLNQTFNTSINFRNDLKTFEPGFTLEPARKYASGLNDNRYRAHADLQSDGEPLLLATSCCSIPSRGKLP